MNKSPFGFEKPQDSPGFLLWQTTMSWQRLIKKTLESHDISHAQFVIMAILLWLDEHGYSPTQVMIANWSKLDKMTVSSSLKKLAQQELVSRAEHATDTRANSITLTQKGKELVCKLVPMVEQIDATFFAKATPSEQNNLIQILNTLTKDSDE